MTMLALLFSTCCLVPQEPSPQLTHGPLRGPNGATALSLWARAEAPGEYRLHLRSLTDGAASEWPAVARAEGDLTLAWQAAGLSAGAAYDWWITAGERTVHPAGGVPLTTAIPEQVGSATIAFGSCSSDTGFPEQGIWGQILARSPQALVLLGDTPYIDNGTVAGRRQRFRAFYAFPPVRAAMQSIPTWATWDDHDYALNDTFGATKGSETARQVFCEYHAHPVYGDGQQGIYTSFRRGPIEVFVLDARSFADRETSPLAAGERSLLGAAQIAWLQQGLLASTAPFKVLACGMIWNEAVRPGKADSWGNWLPERNGLLRWLGERSIGGVVLVGGDVHRTRVVLHPSAALAGYDVPELITSPLAQNVIAVNKVDVAGLEFDAGEPMTCLFLSALGLGDDAVLLACFQAADGREFHSRRFPLATLRQSGGR